MKDSRILIVEDEGIEALDLEHRLTNLGYTVTDMVSTGEEAVMKAEEMRPDIVLMDIMLSGEMDGIKAAGEIHARFDIPIIFLTAYADEDTLRRAKIAEPYSYLVKPFKERDLHISIDIALYKHKMEKGRKKAEKKIKALNEELKEKISKLEEEQQEVQQQAEELQMSNSQLEEQQQQLQQQAEELQMSNSQLEEQQQQLQQHSEELSIKNEHLEELSQKLEQTNKYKSEFLANMSHELRTPLNSIILLSKLLSLQNKNIGEKEIEKIEVINHAGNELLRLINDLLDISRIEAGKVTLSKTRFHTSEIIEEKRNMFAHVASEKGLNFILEDRLQKSIYTDKAKLSQILRNFLSNSFKFTKKGVIRFVIEENKDPGYPVRFSVADSGIGIPKDKLEIIFEAFTQGDGTISREYSGTGLGLFISKGLAQAIGGKIEVQSEEAKGTKITLFLKTDIYEEEKGIDEKSSAASKASAEKIKNGSFLNKKILVVDDDVTNIFLMTNALGDLGAEIFEAQNGKEALELMEKQKFDLVLMDIMMPVMDGYQAMKLIRAKEKFKDVAIIAITAKALKEDYLKCIEAGADAYLSKPIDYDNMMHLLKACINKR